MLPPQPSAERIATHTAPVWGDRANFIIRAFLRESEGIKEWEQLWVMKVSTDVFELCCIPFFAYGLSLGDRVQTQEIHGVPAVVSSVITHSGRVTFRLWFGDGSLTENEKARRVSALQSVGCLTEWSSANMLAVDSPSAQHGKHIEQIITNWKNAGDIQYERGTEE